MGDVKGLEVLMTDGWPTMPPMGGGGWVWVIGPVESGGEGRNALKTNKQDEKQMHPSKRITVLQPDRRNPSYYQRMKP